MIRENSVNLISDLICKILTYGFANHMNVNSLEAKLIGSSIITNLENGDDSFLYNNFNDELYIKNFYGVNEEINYKSNKVASWIAESYVNLFIKYKKSFAFILLYLPIEKMEFLFDKYHEISHEHLDEYFIKEIKEKSIIKLLLKKKSITQPKLSILTGININIINKYSSNNKYIYGAGFDNVYKISATLGVNPYIFLEKLDINLDTSIYKYDKTNPIYRSFLGLYYLAYYDSKIDINKWTYKKENNYFINKVTQNKIYVRFLNNIEEDDLLKFAKNLSKAIASKNETILILFDYKDNLFSAFDCKLFNKLGFQNVYIINKLGILNTNNEDVMTLIDKYNVNACIISRAKDSANEYLKEKI